MLWNQTVIAYEYSNTVARNVLQHAELGMTKDPIIVLDVEINNCVVLQRGVLDELDFAADCAFCDEI